MIFERVEQLTDGQIVDLHRLYQGEWWTRGRQLADVRTMLEHSDVTLGLCDEKRLAGFARVLTDGALKALVLDVIVDPQHRGRGLGRALMDGVLTHPRLRGVRHFELYCLPEMTSYYRRWGFTEETRRLCLMRAETRQCGDSEGPYEVVGSLSDSQRTDFERMYGAVWWTQGQPLPDLDAMLQASDLVVGLCDLASGQLIAFARVITDFVYKAIILDVIVDEPFRGGGWGRRIMDEVVGHPSLRSVRHLELCCLPEMFPFYRRWGFSDDLGELRLMRKWVEQP